MTANVWASLTSSHIWGWMCSRWQIHKFSFLCACDIAVIAQMAAINHGQMFQKTKCKAEQLEEEASKRTMGARKSSGCCLHPQDEWTFCWEALHAAGAFFHCPSGLNPAVGTNRGSRTLRWFYRKWDDREEALRAVWTVKPPDVSLYFLRFDRETNSDSCCCCPWCKLPRVWFKRWRERQIEMHLKELTWLKPGPDVPFDSTRICNFRQIKASKHNWEGQRQVRMVTRRSSIRLPAQTPLSCILKWTGWNRSSLLTVSYK